MDVVFKKSLSRLPLGQGEQINQLVVIHVREDFFRVRLPFLFGRSLEEFEVFPILRVPTAIFPIHKTGDLTILHDDVARREIAMRKNDPVMGILYSSRESHTHHWRRIRMDAGKKILVEGAFLVARRCIVRRHHPGISDASPVASSNEVGRRSD